MKSSFPGHFANGAADMKRLWEQCIFVLDANVLLSLYRFSDTTRNELMRVFKSLNDRLWVPHQVAQEYLANRLSVIGDQVKAYEDSIKQVKTLKSSLENSNHQPFVSARVLADANKVFDKLIGEFSNSKDLHGKKIHSDDIKDYLEGLLEGKVGAPYPREELEKILVHGKERYDEKIPPGYADKKKGGESVVFADKCKPYGDYIVWLQLIDKAKADGKPIVFVTGDVKEDWWLSYQGKTIGPQPALIHEFQLTTGADFYMYTPHNFIERANKHLQQGVSQGAVDEIRGATEEAEQANIRAAEDAVISDSRLNTAVDSKLAREYQLMLKRTQLAEQRIKLKAELEKVSALRNAFESDLITATSVGDNAEIDRLMSHLNYQQAQISSLQRELEHTHIMIAECNRLLHEYRESNS